MMDRSRIDRAVANLARRIARDPMRASVNDTRIMARAILRALGEHIPDEVRP